MCYKTTFTDEYKVIDNYVHKWHHLIVFFSLPPVRLFPVANEDAESSTRPQASFARKLSCMFTLCEASFVISQMAKLIPLNSFNN